jgi:hypothetical protein
MQPQLDPGPRERKRNGVRPSYLFSKCMSCDERNPSALLRRGDGFVCGVCEAKERGRPEMICKRCEKSLPFEDHHIFGWRISNETEVLCINCHRIVHAIKEKRG